MAMDKLLVTFWLGSGIVVAISIWLELLDATARRRSRSAMTSAARDRRSGELDRPIQKKAAGGGNLP
jgi:hypothetical protein